MYKTLTPVQITGLAMYDYIINQELAETILEKMYAVNKLENVEYETIDSNKITETYTREIYLNGKLICNPTKKYEYTEEETPSIQLNKEENVTLEDLREYLISADYLDILKIAKEIAMILERRNNEQKLILK